jgi:hypothetical protein
MVLVYLNDLLAWRRSLREAIGLIFHASSALSRVWRETPPGTDTSDLMSSVLLNLMDCIEAIDVAIDGIVAYLDWMRRQGVSFTL